MATPESAPVAKVLSALRLDSRERGVIIAARKNDGYGGSVGKTTAPASPRTCCNIAGMNTDVIEIGSRQPRLCFSFGEARTAPNGRRSPTFASPFRAVHLQDLPHFHRQLTDRSTLKRTNKRTTHNAGRKQKNLWEEARVLRQAALTTHG